MNAIPSKANPGVRLRLQSGDQTPGSLPKSGNITITIDISYQEDYYELQKIGERYFVMQEVAIEYTNNTHYNYHGIIHKRARKKECRISKENQVLYRKRKIRKRNISKSTSTNKFKI